MSDKDLLEKAAKAAGYDIGLWVRQGSWAAAEGCYGFDMGDTLWNPLEDDGDALRLAITLNLPIIPHTHGIGWVDVGQIKELCGSDPLAATRRAIVRSAASKSSHPTP